MPIYSYRCEDCGHTQDILRKMSDPLLVTCPSCGKPSFKKQVTAAGFQLKGSGWYVTDFRNPASKEQAKAGKSDADGAPAAAPADGAASPPVPSANGGAVDSKPVSPPVAESKPGNSSKGGKGGKSETAPGGASPTSGD